MKAVMYMIGEHVRLLDARLDEMEQNITEGAEKKQPASMKKRAPQIGTKRRAPRL